MMTGRSDESIVREAAASDLVRHCMATSSRTTRPGERKPGSTSCTFSSRCFTSTVCRPYRRRKSVPRRRSMLDDMHEQIRVWLAEAPGVTAIEVLGRLKATHPDRFTDKQ